MDNNRLLRHMKNTEIFSPGKYPLPQSWESLPWLLFCLKYIQLFDYYCLLSFYFSLDIDNILLYLKSCDLFVILKKNLRHIGIYCCACKYHPPLFRDMGLESKSCGGLIAGSSTLIIKFFMPACSFISPYESYFASLPRYGVIKCSRQFILKKAKIYGPQSRTCWTSAGAATESIK